MPRRAALSLVLERMLHARGFDVDDYQLIEVGGWSAAIAHCWKERVSATLLTEPFVRNALAANCNLLARDFEMIPSYQGTCGATSRHWAEQHPERLSRYIRAYVEATQWCFVTGGIDDLALDILARHNEIDGPAAEHTLDTLLDPEHGLYPKATINLPGVAAALDLQSRAGLLGVSCSARREICRSFLLPESLVNRAYDYWLLIGIQSSTMQP